MAPSRVAGGMSHSSSSSGIFFQGDRQSHAVGNSHLSSSFGNSSNSLPGNMRPNLGLVSGDVSNTILNSVANSGPSVGASSLVTDANSGLSGGPHLQRSASINTDSYMRLPASPMSFSSNNISISGSSVMDGSSVVQQSSNQDPHSQPVHQSQQHQGASSATSLPTARMGQVSLPGSFIQDPTNISQLQKKPRLDIKQEDILQQQVINQILQRQDSMQLQTPNPQLHALIQQQRLRQQQQQLLQSMPPVQRAHLLQQQQQQQLQLRQQLQKQGVQPSSGVKRPYDSGVCSRRLMQYLYHQRQRPPDNTIAYWRKFVTEYYSPRAKKRWCLSLYDNVGHHSLGVFPQAAMDAWQCDNSIVSHTPVLRGGLLRQILSLLSSFVPKKRKSASLSIASAMHETELHDLSDDADYAASLQQGSASMTRSDSSKMSSSSEPEFTELVYLKDNVSIHPTQYASERISGRLKLIKQGSLIFMTWIPYKGQSSNARLSERDKNLYTIRSVPLTEIRSIRRHTPTLGWQYVIVVLSSGLAFPPLYFYNGGVREFLATIKQHVFLVRSAEDANVFLVNNFQDPLQRTLSSLELPRAVAAANGPSPSVSTSEKTNNEKTNGSVFDGSLSSLQQNGRQKQKSHDPARDLSIHVLEKFSLVTRFARETTSQLFRENSDGFGTSEKRKHNQSSHDHPRNTASIDVKVPDEIPVVPDPLEVDKLTLMWGKPRQPPLGPEEWSTFLDSEGRVVDAKALRKRIFYGGLEHSLRKEVWTFLLGYHVHDSTYAERDYLVLVKKSAYMTIKNQWQSISEEQAKRFTKFRERKGLIEKDVVRTDRSLSFYEGDDNPNVNLLRDILLTYSFYNFDLGYCQGMSDLLSPILFVMKDESEAFWCFVSLMKRLGPNFNRDQNGMHSQLFALSKLVELLDSPLHNYFQQNDCLNYFFCFRWVLIQFKREFEYERTLRLWEVLWTHYLSEHLHLYVCVAILKKHRSKIMGEQMDFDTLLKFINELSGQIDLDAILRDAEALCICAGENGAASIPPGTPPSLPIEDGSLLPQQDDDDVL